MIARSLLLLHLYLMLLACCTDGCPTKTGEKYEALFLDKIMKAWKLDSQLREHILDDSRYINLRRKVYHALKFVLMPKMLEKIDYLEAEKRKKALLKICATCPWIFDKR
ncbi:uncharacterized protein LOC106068830 isoform X1 [Biomphalaria glabrata]|uniref:Uncharacterized protein LOC106068830 isoform X1 n=1 Tax=Biomphalaria glabrata TaxID=6526 RepID=A0A9W3AXD6_BIOGL|nr:uncharacterized protein LOC106068830 isoform X1 [Biomphalaria glabrata]